MCLNAKNCIDKIQETIELGGNQILLQGGMNPDLKIEWYEDLLRDIKQHFPTDKRARFQSAGDRAHRQNFDLEHRRRFAAIERRPAWAVCPAAGRKFWSIACGAKSVHANALPIVGSKSAALGTNLAVEDRPR